MFFRASPLPKVRKLATCKRSRCLFSICAELKSQIVYKKSCRIPADFTCEHSITTRKCFVGVCLSSPKLPAECSELISCQKPTFSIRTLTFTLNFSQTRHQQLFSGLSSAKVPFFILSGGQTFSKYLFNSMNMRVEAKKLS